MRKNFAVSATLILVVVVAAPVYGSMLEVSGKYVGSLMYDGEAADQADSVTSINPGGTTKCADLLGMSTLYLTFDFVGKSILKERLQMEDLPADSLLTKGSPEDRPPAETAMEKFSSENGPKEGGSFNAHVPLILFKDVERGEFAVALDPNDEYLFAYKGDLFSLSLTDATRSDYAFVSLKDPLGLVREIDTEDMVVLKVTGEPWGTDILGYLVRAVFTDKKGETRESRYGAMRATYELPAGVGLGLTYGIHRKPANSGDDNNTGCGGDIGADGDIDRDVNIDIDENISIDMEIPIPLSKKATLQGALAVNTGTKAGNPYEPKHAFSFKVRKLQLRNITLVGDLIAVEHGFAVVAHKKDSSDAFDYEGKRYLRGEGRTMLHLFGRNVKIALANERATNYDGSFDLEKGSSKNKVSGEVEFKLSSDVILTLDGYLDKTLADTGDYLGDHTMRARAKMSYESPEGNEIWGRLWQVAKEHREAQGTAYKLECGVKIKSTEYGKLEGKGGYEQGTLTFPSYTSVGEYTRKLSGEVYGELEHAFMSDDVDQVDMFLAGLAKYLHRERKSPEVTLVAYGEINIVIDKRLTNTTALLLAREPKKTSHYAPTLYNKLDCKLRDNASFALGYTFKGKRGTLEALYTVMIGDATFEVGYGKTGLRDECTDTGHTGKPWAWLCSAEADPRPKLFTLTIAIPFQTFVHHAK